MKKADVTFVFQGGNSQNYARTRQNGNYSNEGYSVDELISFLINAINNNEIKRGTKTDFGPGKKVVYKFKYKDTDTNLNKTTNEQLCIVIPSKNRGIYKDAEKQLNSLLSISKKLNKASIAKVAALMAVGVTLMTFATIKVAKLADEEYKQDQKRVNDYVNSLKQGPQVSEYDKLCYEINELESQINSGMIPSDSLESYQQKLANLKNKKTALEVQTDYDKQITSKVK